MAIYLKHMICDSAIPQDDDVVFGLPIDTFISRPFIERCRGKRITFMGCNLGMAEEDTDPLWKTMRCRFRKDYKPIASTMTPEELASGISGLIKEMSQIDRNSVKCDDVDKELVAIRNRCTSESLTIDSLPSISSGEHA